MRCEKCDVRSEKREAACHSEPLRQQSPKEIASRRDATTRSTRVSVTNVAYLDEYTYRYNHIMDETSMIVGMLG